jgi:hypothetical protein
MTNTESIIATCNFLFLWNERETIERFEQEPGLGSALQEPRRDEAENKGEVCEWREEENKEGDWAWGFDEGWSASNADYETINNTPSFVEIMQGRNE